MKKLYSYSKLFLFISLCNTIAIQSMEVTVPEQQEPVQHVVPSLQSLCAKYIGENAQQFNVLDELATLPTECAVDTLLFANANWINENRAALIDLVKSKNTLLGAEIQCAIIQKLNNLELAYAFAKQGHITLGVASVITDTLPKIDINEHDFKTKFTEAFPPEILEHNNYGIFYDTIMKKLAKKKYSLDLHSLPPEAVLNFKKDFDVCEFQDVNLTLQKEIHPFWPHPFTYSLEQLMNFASQTSNNKTMHYRCKDGFFTLSPCKRFLAVCDNHGRLELYNLETKNKVRTTLIGLGYNKIDKLIFNHDCSSIILLGTHTLLSTQNSVYTINNLPMLLLKNKLSLQNLSLLVYGTTTHHLTVRLDIGIFYLAYWKNIIQYWDSNIIKTWGEEDFLAEIFKRI